MSNPGKQPAKDVKLVVSLPREGGKLVALVGDAKFGREGRTLTWSIPLLEPGKNQELLFGYGTNTPGSYKATAEATSGDLRAKCYMITEVSAVAVLDVKVSQTSRVMDVGKTNFYDITIKNTGTKEATRLRLTGKLIGNLKILKQFNVEKGEFKFNADSGEFVAPEIERLDVGKSITLSLEVQATGSGPAGCHVFLRHDAMGAGDKVEDVISTTVRGEAKHEPAAKPQAAAPRKDDYFAFFKRAFW